MSWGFEFIGNSAGVAKAVSDYEQDGEIDQLSIVKQLIIAECSALPPAQGVRVIASGTAYDGNVLFRELKLEIRSADLKIAPAERS